MSTQPGGRAGASLDHVRVSDCGLLSGYAGYAADSITTTILSVRLVACCHQTKINFRVLHFHTYKTTPWVIRRLGEEETPRDTTRHHRGPTEEEEEERRTRVPTRHHETPPGPNRGGGGGAEDTGPAQGLGVGDDSRTASHATHDTNTEHDFPVGFLPQPPIHRKGCSGN